MSFITYDLIFLGLFIVFVVLFLSTRKKNLTKQGIMLFYPFKFRVKGFLQTNGIVEKVFLVILAVINIIYIINLLK